MSGNTNPDKQGIFTENLVGDFSALTARAQAVISALSGLTIGTPVAGSVGNRILFSDPTAKLNEDFLLNYDSSVNRLGIGENEPVSAKLHINTGGGAEVGQIIKGGPLQTGNLLEVRPSTTNLPVFEVRENFAFFRAISGSFNAAQFLILQPDFASSLFIKVQTEVLLSPSAGVLNIGTDGGELYAKIDNNAVAGNTRLMIWDVDNGQLERVSVGAPDSGGAGFKVLRIPN